MNAHNLKRHMIFRIALLALLTIIVCAKAAYCEEATASAPLGWHFGISIGVVDFVSPMRSASTISDPKMGGAFDLSAIQRPLPYLGVGCRGEFLFVPSGEDDAAATFGARAMLVLRAIVPVGKTELHVGPEVGYSYLGRRVTFENADRVSFQGATVGLSMGVERPLSDSVSLGGIARVNHVLGTLTCTSKRCHMPRKGRNPGPSLFVGVSSVFMR
jgi:hypothetical protein